MKKNTHQHIVISPPEHLRPQLLSYLDALEPLLIKHTVEYVMALETGSHDEETHIDIYANFKKGQDSTDIKRKYSKLFPFPLELPAFIAKSIKTPNPAIMAGYTLKEIPENYRTNIPDHKLNKLQQEYQSKQKEKYDKTKFKIIKTKQIIKLIGTYLENIKIDAWNTYMINHYMKPWTLDEMPRFFPYKYTIKKHLQDSILELLEQGYYLDITKTQKNNIYRFFTDYYTDPENSEAPPLYFEEFLDTPPVVTQVTIVD